jgi:hypothetical protein
VNFFQDYDQASAFAWKRAKDTGLDQGIEKVGQVIGPAGFKVTFLPSPKNTFDHELRIERVIAPKKETL